MIIVYRRQGNAVVREELTSGASLPDDAVWIDLHSPSHEEEIAVERQLGIQIPSKEEVWKNNVLNRLYEENDTSYMTAAIITKVDCPHPQTSAVTFILTPAYLLTMRFIAPTSFQIFGHRIQRTPQRFQTSTHVLEGLLEEIITRVAHNSEVVVGTLDDLSHNIFRGNMLNDRAKSPSQQMKTVLTELGTCADLNSKINESLHSINRMLSFFRQTNRAGAEIDNNIAILMTDVTALTRQTGFLSDKITFQLDATLGMINVEQNMIIKIFSVVAVFFLPPTLISSMYGMNFRDMPELHWAYGYPMAVGLMMLCALVPYLYFRKKGWL